VNLNLLLALSPRETESGEADAEQGKRCGLGGRLDVICKPDD
jgi:hypothetical protein